MHPNLARWHAGSEDADIEGHPIATGRGEHIREVGVGDRRSHLRAVRPKHSCHRRSPLADAVHATSVACTEMRCTPEMGDEGLGVEIQGRILDMCVIGASEGFRAGSSPRRSSDQHSPCPPLGGRSRTNRWCQPASIRPPGPLHRENVRDPESEGVRRHPRRSCWSGCR